MPDGLVWASLPAQSVRGYMTMRLTRILILNGDVKITDCPYNETQYFLMS